MATSWRKSRLSCGETGFRPEIRCGTPGCCSGPRTPRCPVCIRIPGPSRLTAPRHQSAALRRSVLAGTHGFDHRSGYRPVAGKRPSPHSSWGATSTVRSSAGQARNRGRRADAGGIRGILLVRHTRAERRPAGSIVDHEPGGLGSGFCPVRFRRNRRKNSRPMPGIRARFSRGAGEVTSSWPPRSQSRTR